MTDILASTTHSTARTLWGWIAVVLGTGLAGAGCALLEQVAPGSGNLTVMLVMLAPLTIIGIHDVRTLRVPDLATAAIAVSAASYTLTQAVITADAGTLWGPASAALTLGGFYFVLGVFGGVGFGDVKLAAALGLWLGGFDYLAWLLVPVLAILLSGTQQIFRVVRRRRAPLPHAPALAVSAVLTAVLLFIFMRPLS